MWTFRWNNRLLKNTKLEVKILALVIFWKFHPKLENQVILRVSHIQAENHNGGQAEDVVVHQALNRRQQEHQGAVLVGARDRRRLETGTGKNDMKKCLQMQK